MKIHWMTALALVLASCGKSAPRPLPTDPVKLAETCYFASLQHAVKADGKPRMMTAADILGPISYFAIAAVRAKKGAAATIDDLGDFTNDSAMATLYTSTDHRDQLPECQRRFPRAAAAATFPADPAEKAATCLYIARFAPGIVQGAQVARDPVVASADEIRTRIGRDDAAALAIAKKYAIASTDDADRLAARIIYGSVDVGSLYAILKGCRAAQA